MIGFFVPWSALVQRALRWPAALWLPIAVAALALMGASDALAVMLQ